MSSFALGAEGCYWQTEKIFLSSRPVNVMQKYLLCSDPTKRTALLCELGNICRDSYVQLFRELRSSQIIANIVDPSMTDIFPSISEAAVEILIRNIALELDQDCMSCMVRMKDLLEQNPSTNMHCSRLVANFPEIADIQFRSLLGGYLI